jgi:adhesin transport system membrane fusion protein
MRTSYWIIITISVALVGFILWANWATLDQVTRAPGKAIPFGRVQIVQSEEGGPIAAINVREGDKVEKGQLLVELDRVKLDAGVRESRAQVAALQSRMARINAELFDRPLTFPASVSQFPEFVTNQRQLFQRRRAALQSELGSLASMARLQREELSLNEPLVGSGDVARSEIIRMRREVVQTEGQMSNIRSQYIQDLQTEFTETEEELVAAQQTLAQRERSLQSANLVAPANGIVKNVRLTTVGGVLAPGDEVLQIVPTEDRLIVEAQVPPRDIAYVRQGQEARVNFDAYDYTIYGAADGRVVYISPDTLSEEGPDGRVNTYYRVNLEVDISNLRPRREGEVIDLQPGMTATADIKTGEQTVFEYLTKPLLKTSHQAMRER